MTKGLELELDGDLMTRENIELAIATTNDVKIDTDGVPTGLTVTWLTDTLPHKAHIISEDIMDYFALGMSMAVVFQIATEIEDEPPNITP